MVGDFLDELCVMVRSKKEADVASSYTAKLFERGTDFIAQKVGEEAVEVVVASLAQGNDALVSESADLLYHLIVLWEKQGIAFEDVIEELRRRQK